MLIVQVTNKYRISDITVGMTTILSHPQCLLGYFSEKVIHFGNERALYGPGSLVRVFYLWWLVGGTLLMELGLLRDIFGNISM